MFVKILVVIKSINHNISTLLPFSHLRMKNPLNPNIFSRKSYTDRNTFIDQSSSMTFGSVFYKFWIISLIAMTTRWIIGLISLITFFAGVSKQNIISGSQRILSNIATALPTKYELSYNSETWFSSNQSSPVNITIDQIITGIDLWEIFDRLYQLDREVMKYDIKYFITIDTTSGVSITDLAKQSLFTITATQWVLNQETIWETIWEKTVYDLIWLAMHVTPLTITPVKITQERSPALTVFIEKNRSTFWTRSYIVGISGWIIGILIGSLVVALFASVLMFLYALIIYVIGKISKQSRSYTTSYGMMSLSFLPPFLLGRMFIRLSGWPQLLIAMIIRAIIISRKSKTTP